MDNITYVEKDQLLKALCENFKTETPYSHIPPKRVEELAGLSSSVINRLFNYFNRIGLTKDASITRNSVTLILCQDGFDLFYRGGFTLREHQLKQEIKKLSLEIKELTPTLGARAAKLTTIVSNLVSIANVAVSYAPK
jgi:hypothetical protein